MSFDLLKSVREQRAKRRSLPQRLARYERTAELHEFEYQNKGPWPQPSPDRPASEAPRVLHLPRKEYWRHFRKVMLRYYWQLATKTPYFYLKSHLKSDLDELSDEELKKWLCCGLYSRFLRFVPPHGLNAKDTGGSGDEQPSHGSEMSTASQGVQNEAGHPHHGRRDKILELFRLNPDECQERTFAYSDFTPLELVRKLRHGVYLYSCLCLFERDVDDKTGFRFVGILIGHQVETNQEGSGEEATTKPESYQMVRLPTAESSREDKELWRLAKYYLVAAANTCTNLIGHSQVHFPADAPSAISMTCLPKSHVLHKLLAPHTRLNLGVNHSVLEGEGSLISRTYWNIYDPFAAGGEEIRRLLAVAWSGCAGAVSVDPDRPHLVPIPKDIWEGPDVISEHYPAFSYPTELFRPKESESNLELVMNENLEALNDMAESPEYIAKQIGGLNVTHPHLSEPGAITTLLHTTGAVRFSTPYAHFVSLYFLVIYKFVRTVLRASLRDTLRTVVGYLRTPDLKEEKEQVSLLLSGGTDPVGGVRDPLALALLQALAKSEGVDFRMFNEPFVISRWASYISDLVPGFPSSVREMFWYKRVGDGAKAEGAEQKDTQTKYDVSTDPLACALTFLIWNVSVVHAADHQLLSEMSAHKVPFRLRIRWPRKMEKFQLEGRAFVDWRDIMQSLYTFELFYKPFNDLGLALVDYGFEGESKPELSRAEQHFREDLRSLDDQLEQHDRGKADEHKLRFVKLDQIASSIQY